MNSYRVIRKSDGIQVYQYQAEAMIEWPGMEYTTHDHVLTDPPQEILTQTARVYEALDFLRRFTPQERITARQAAKTDPIMEDFYALLEMAAQVHNDDADVLAGMGYMVQMGYITAERRTEVLYG